MSNFEDFGRRIDKEVSRLKKINNLETFGRHVDEELKRVKDFVKEDVAPETEKRTAQFLREVSEKLNEAAQWVESHNSSRSGPGSNSSGS
jgi:pyocin large subunit-like protein